MHSSLLQCGPPLLSASFTPVPAEVVETRISRVTIEYKLMENPPPLLRAGLHGGAEEPDDGSTLAQLFGGDDVSEPGLIPPPFTACMSNSQCVPTIVLSVSLYFVRLFQILFRKLMPSVLLHDIGVTSDVSVLRVYNVSLSFSIPVLALPPGRRRRVLLVGCSRR